MKQTYKPFVPKVEENVEEIATPTDNTPEPDMALPATPAADCGSKIVFIHGAEEAEESASKVTGMLKEKLAGCTILDIHLYELNIQTSENAKDGMNLIYKAVEESDIVIFTMDSSKSESLQTVLKRITNKYTESQKLQFKCLSAVVIGEDKKAKEHLLNLAYSLGMLVTPQSIILASSDPKETELMTQIDLAGITMTQVTTKTADLRTNVSNVETTDTESNDENVDDLTNGSGSGEYMSNIGEPEIKSDADPVDTTTDDPAPGEAEDPMEEGSESEDEEQEKEKTEKQEEESEVNSPVEDFDFGDEDEEEESEEDETDTLSFEEWKRINDKPVTETKHIKNVRDFLSLFEKNYFNDKQ